MKAVLDIGVLCIIVLTMGAVGIQLEGLNRIEYTVFAVVYFLTKVPLLLGVVAATGTWWTPQVRRADLAGNPR